MGRNPKTKTTRYICKLWCVVGNFNIVRRTNERKGVNLGRRTNERIR